MTFIHHVGNRIQQSIESFLFLSQEAMAIEDCCILAINEALIQHRLINVAN